ncbi:Lrp/AsnC family transcriptional regulator [Curtobacterium sp. 1P10AnD]|uniref:Lrp/AsnC family transcriptional regulator n=1 Tax=Curtobacterium sp. 1P10AnD TaxID=3132283 RepID=UPI0039A3D33F
MMEGIARTVRLRVITKRKALHTMEPLDQTDRKILALLQTDGRLSGAEVGRRVGLSQPAASARILRLERQGIITGYRATVDPAAVGLNIHAVVRLRTTHAHLGAALQLAARTDEVTSTRRVTGEDCLILDVHCGDAGRLEQVVDSLARFGPVSTALVLRDYPDKPLMQYRPTGA